MRHLYENIRDLRCVFRAASEPLDHYDESYAQKAHAHALRPASVDELSLVTQLLNGSRPRRILDVGCNTGVPLNSLCRRFGARGYGIDINAAALKTARASFPECDHLLYDGARFPFDDATFDHVCLHHVIGHCASPTAILTETNRVLRPGGTLSVITPNGWYKIFQFPFNLWRGFRPDGTILRYFTSRQLSVALRNHGFRIDSLLVAGEAPTGCPSWFQESMRLRVIAIAAREETR